MKGYRRFYIKPGTPELAARVKHQEEAMKIAVEMLENRKQATENNVPAPVKLETPKDATQS